MNWEGELNRLAREREDALEFSLSQMELGDPAKLLRHLRSYLGELTDRGKLRRTNEGLRLVELEGGVKELVCDEVEFRYDSRLTFSIRMGKEQKEGWLMKQFRFHLYLARPKINMIRIHLKDGHDPLKIPRCHLHIGDSKAHIPFPIMSPRLMVHLICEHMEPDLGL